MASANTSFDGVGLAELVLGGDVKPSELVEAAIDAPAAPQRDAERDRVRRLRTTRAVPRRGHAARRSVPRRAVPRRRPVHARQGLADDQRLALVRTPHQRRGRRAGALLPLEAAWCCGRGEQHAGVRHHRHDRERVPRAVRPQSEPAATSRAARAADPRRRSRRDRADGARVRTGFQSIRIPAACCGLVGLKTTRDQNPIRSPEAGGIIFSVNHIVSAPCDSAVMLDWTGQPQKHARTSRRRGEGPSRTRRSPRSRQAAHLVVPSRSAVRRRSSTRTSRARSTRPCARCASSATRWSGQPAARRLAEALSRAGHVSAGNFAGMMADHAAGASDVRRATATSKLSRWIWENGKRVTAELHFPGSTC